MYKLIEGSTSVIRLEDGAIIPEDIRNKDWVAYQNWLNNGNSAEPVDPPTIVEQASRINAQATSDILAIAPEYKQRNMLARSVELINKGHGNLTAEELQELDEYQSVWEQIKAIRDKSDLDIKLLQ